MRTYSTKSKIVVAAVTAGTLGVSGVAYAYFTTTGNGTGAATTGTSSAFAVTTDTATGGPLTPGGPSETIAFHVKNNNSGVQRLSAVAVTVAASNGSAWTTAPGCSAADFTVGTPSFASGDVASGATVDGTVTITMNNLGTPQDGCKSITVPLYVAAS